MKKTCSLHIHDIKHLVSIGFHQHEVMKKQFVVIDIQIDLHDGYLESIDDARLETSYDYDAAYKLIQKIVESKHFNLLETMGNEIIQELIASDHKISAIALAIRKPDAYQNGFSECKISINR